MMRKHCVEVQEFENDLLFEQQFKSDWMQAQMNLHEWLKFEAALNRLTNLDSEKIKS